MQSFHHADKGKRLAFLENVGGNTVVPSMFSWARRTIFPPTTPVVTLWRALHSREADIRLHPFGEACLIHKAFNDIELNQKQHFNCSF